ncbi:hypothetical protein LCGC14_2424880 [marine sediment metagenome]|uniref:Uncharacterized protein n=1 Tax=marine sediment metagenome TaxID=412755 RepID=A0A0F9CAS8_9ZZZZ
MAVSVNLQNNPTPANAGKTEANAVAINSGFSNGVVTYEIRRFDRQPMDMNKSQTLSIPTNTSRSYNDVVLLTSSQLQIVLPHRTLFEARAQRNSGTWTAWVQFTTRDKKYSTPGAVSQISDDSKTQDPTVKGSRTITVANNAKATVATTARGATVTNSDNGYVATTGITYTSRGATVNNSE